MKHLRFGLDPEGTCIWDDDFNYDATINVMGDFPSKEERIAYMQAICDALNKAQIPTGSEP